jgi:hypothetical protein
LGDDNVQERAHRCREPVVTFQTRFTNEEAATNIPRALDEKSREPAEKSAAGRGKVQKDRQNQRRPQGKS